MEMTMKDEFVTLRKNLLRIEVFKMEKITHINTGSLQGFKICFLCFQRPPTLARMTSSSVTLNENPHVSG